MQRRGELLTIGGDFASPVINAQRDWHARESLLYRVIDQESGQVGLGEAAPLPGYSPDKLKDCYLALEEIELPTGELSLDRIRRLLGALPPTLPAARYALECALLDLFAQKQQTSIASLLGGTATTASRCALLVIDTALDSASELTVRGVGTAKLKVGRDWPEELRVIRALRSRYPDLQLRLDANGAWSVPEAKVHLRELTNLDIQFVEQPVAPLNMAQLGNSLVPLAADESMRSPQMRDILMPLIDDRSLVAIVVKPTVLGGLLACMDLAAWASTHDLATIASHTFEGPVGTAGVAELAVATKGVFAAGLDAHPGLAILSALAVPQLAKVEIASHASGLGLRWPT